MSVRPFFVAFLTLAAALGSIPRNARAVEDQKKNLTRNADAVVLSGDVTAALHGKLIENIRVFSLREGKFEPLPYQIDKKDVEGDYIIPQNTVTAEIIAETGFDPRSEGEKRIERIKEFEKNQRRYERALEKGEITRADYESLRQKIYFQESNDVFDYNDEIVFMAHDAGDRVVSSLWPVGEGTEIEIENPGDSSLAWVYLFVFPANPPPRSPVDYVGYDPKADRTESHRSVLDFIDNKPLILEKIIPKQPDGKLLPNILDRFKLRIKLKPKPLFCFPLHFDENNTKAFTVGYKDGPVRVIRRNIFWITFAGFKVPFFPKAIVYYVFYENALLAPTEIYNPFNPAYILCDGSVFTGGVDLRKSTYGVRIYTRDNPGGIVIDGKMGDGEQHIVREEQDWIVAFKEDDAVGIVVRVIFDDELKKKGARKAFTFIDDAEGQQPPEDEPGVHFMGYDVDLKHFPKGKYKIELYQYIAFGFHKGEEQPFLDILDRPLKIRAKRR